LLSIEALFFTFLNIRKLETMQANRHLHIICLMALHHFLWHDWSTAQGHLVATKT